jgi:hypothetical protein
VFWNEDRGFIIIWMIGLLFPFNLDFIHLMFYDISLDIDGFCDSFLKRFVHGLEGW